MVLRLLGPVGLVVGGRSVDVGGPRQRVVLALLGLSANRVVPVEHLIDAVWGAAPPSTARGQVQICISGLRKLFVDAGLPDAITTRQPGYLLRVPPDDVDSVRFTALVATAREQADAGRPVDAIGTLRSALELWRGPALGGATGDVVARAATVLQEQRLAAVEERIRLELAVGWHDEVVCDLRSLVAEHPLRERLHALLMLALYRAGRQAEALEAGRRARAVLVEEIGVEPGRELREMERAILVADPALCAPRNPAPVRDGLPASTPADPPADREPAVPVPRQLPACAADFTGREDQIAEIVDRLGAEPDERGWAMPIVAVSGKGGVGKSSLAARAAHQLAPRYPDGQLYADMGSVAGNDHTDQLLARFLRALGVAGSAVPEDPLERAELYRSTLSGRRVLLVLDDVAGEAQVLPLLPGSPTCAVITTSRARLCGLPGAHIVDVDVFDVDSSVDLLTRVVGQGRVDAEPDAVAELARLCGGLPLALRIAGARLASRPHWRVSGLVRRLRDEARVLDEFAHHGLQLRSNIGLTHRGLDERARRLFRRCALVRAPDFPGWTAAALLDCPAADAEEVLEGLVEAQLVDIVQYGANPPRYRLHDLIRLYAAERLHQDETPAERDAALARVLGGWLGLAEEAHRREYGGDYTILHGPAPRWYADSAGDCIGEPTHWWESERRALVAAVRQAADAGLAELCWDLALTSVTLFESKGYFADWHECARVALDCARAAGDHRGAAAMRYSLGTLHLCQGRLDEAEEAYAEALSVFRAIGDDHGTALVLGNSAHIDRLRGDIPAMRAKYEAALDGFRLVGDRVGEVLVLCGLARHHLDDGDHDAASDLLHRALEISRQTGCGRVEAQVVHRFAELHLSLDRVDLARDALHRVLRVVRDRDDRIGEVHALYGLGLLRHREGRLDSAETTLVHALDLARRLGERLVEAKTRLALGELSIARGDEAGGASHLRTARTLFDVLGSTPWSTRVTTRLAEGTGHSRSGKAL